MQYPYSAPQAQIRPTLTVNERPVGIDRSIGNPGEGYAASTPGPSLIKVHFVFAVVRIRRNKESIPR
jgi:hypothetical protein